MMTRGILIFCIAAVLSMSGCATPPKEGAPPGPAAAGTPAAAVAGAPSVEQYIIGAEDLLRISVWKDENLTTDAVVRSDGMISVPLVNDVKASGLTALQLKEEITNRLKEYIPGVEVTVVVMEMRSNKVYIQGEVQKPGPQPFNGNLTVIQALALAGGLTPYADKNSIMILRASGQQLQFDYSKVSRGRNMDQNVILKRGDTIIVP
jgi:polysaccharide export outer membrane protein